MFDKLDIVERKYVELTDRLNSGTLEPKEWQSLAKEQAGLRELITTYRHYRSAQKQLQDNKDLLMQEKDEAMRELVKQDLARLGDDIHVDEEKLKVLLLPKDSRDDKNVIVEIRAGTGGEEAALFAADLFRMYSRFAEAHGWRVELMSQSDAEKGGFKEVIVLVSGDKVFSKLKFESGIHRVQRVPQTEANGRIHTSAVTVAVLPEAEDIELNIPETDLRIDVFRAGGHGGQSVNTTDSAVRITHNPSGLVVICQDEKSQHKNKAKAMKVLRSRLLDKMQSEQNAKEAAERRAMVGSGDRSEKIRTYNFPQSRVTDHRIGLTIYQLNDVMDGKLSSFIDALVAHDQAEKLKEGVS